MCNHVGVSWPGGGGGGVDGGTAVMGTDCSMAGVFRDKFSVGERAQLALPDV